MELPIDPNKKTIKTMVNLWLIIGITIYLVGSLEHVLFPYIYIIYGIISNQIWDIWNTWTNIRFIYVGYNY